MLKNVTQIVTFFVHKPCSFQKKKIKSFIFIKCVCKLLLIFPPLLLPAVSLLPFLSPTSSPLLLPSWNQVATQLSLMGTNQESAAAFGTVHPLDVVQSWAFYLGPTLPKKAEKHLSAFLPVEGQAGNISQLFFLLGQPAVEHGMYFAFSPCRWIDNQTKYLGHSTNIEVFNLTNSAVSKER